METISIPVLLIAFNRPDTTQKVFDRIQEVKPQKLYVSVDGPRQEKTGEYKLCDEVKSLVKKVDWPCQSFYLFNESNLGAEVTVSSAISWVLEKEDCVIILEDDIVAPRSFFLFMQEMLIKYREEPQIAMVSGSNFTPRKLPEHDDYLFAIYGHIWGWGTWKRAWENFDLFINDFDEKLNPVFLDKFSINNTEKKYNKKLIQRLKAAGPGGNTWDYCWYYYRLTNGLLSVIPRVNLTSNIGVYGFHAKGKTEHHFRKFDENFQVKHHPAIIKRDIEYDRYHFKYYINKSMPFFKKYFKNAVKIFNYFLFRNESK